MAEVSKPDPYETLLNLTLIRPRILRYCAARLGAEEAEDACQEVYLELLRHLAQVEVHPHPVGWLFATARNKCREALRRRKPASELPEIEDLGSPDALTQVLDREGARVLLDRLPPSLRPIAELRAEGYPSREIGRLVQPQISENAVNMRLHRIRQILRPWLYGPGAA